MCVAIWKNLQTHVMPIEAYILQHVIDARITDRLPHDKLFTKLASLYSHQKLSNDASMEPSLRDDPDALLTFFRENGWGTVIKNFVTTFDKMKLLASNMSITPNDADITLRNLMRSSVEWRSASKSKNAPREFSVWISATIFEQMYAPIYRKKLLLSTPGPALRSILAGVLQRHTKNGSYRYWDGIDVIGKNASQNRSSSINTLATAKSNSDIVKKITTHVKSLEAVAMEHLTAAPSSASLVPEEIAYALDVLIKVSIDVNNVFPNY
jgi:hypothetical protein